MNTAINESDDNDDRSRSERPIIRILREQPAGTDPRSAKDGKRYAYLWTLTSRRRKDRTWRNDLSTERT